VTRVTCCVHPVDRVRGRRAEMLMHGIRRLAWVALTEDAEKSTNSWLRLPPRLLRLPRVSKYLLKSIWATYSMMSAASVFALSRLAPSCKAVRQPGQGNVVRNSDDCQHKCDITTDTADRPAAALKRLSLILFGGPCIRSRTKRRSAQHARRHEYYHRMFMVHIAGSVSSETDGEAATVPLCVLHDAAGFT
jgi:hypothetical protein